jgi:hypothetical protein
VRETLQVIRDFKSDHLSPGEMYNFKEISGLLGTMENEVQALVDKVRCTTLLDRWAP